MEYYRWVLNPDTTRLIIQPLLDYAHWQLFEEIESDGDYIELPGGYLRIENGKFIFEQSYAKDIDSKEEVIRRFTEGDYETLPRSEDEADRFAKTSATVELPCSDDHGSGRPFFYHVDTDTLYIGKRDGYHFELFEHGDIPGVLDETDYLFDLGGDSGLSAGYVSGRTEDGTFIAYVGEPEDVDKAREATEEYWNQRTSSTQVQVTEVKAPEDHSCFGPGVWSIMAFEDGRVYIAQRSHHPYIGDIVQELDDAPDYFEAKRYEGRYVEKDNDTGLFRDEGFEWYSPKMPVELQAEVERQVAAYVDTTSVSEGEAVSKNEGLGSEGTVAQGDNIVLSVEKTYNVVRVPVEGEFDPGSFAFIVKDDETIYLSGAGAFHYQIETWLDDQGLSDTPNADDEEYEDWFWNDGTRTGEVQGRYFAPRQKVMFFGRVGDYEAAARAVYDALGIPFTGYEPISHIAHGEWWLEDEGLDEPEEPGEAPFPEDFTVSYLPSITSTYGRGTNPFFVLGNIIYVGGDGAYHYNIQDKLGMDDDDRAAVWLWGRVERDWGTGIEPLNTGSAKILYTYRRDREVPRSLQKKIGQMVLGAVGVVGNVIDGNGIKIHSAEQLELWDKTEDDPGSFKEMYPSEYKIIDVPVSGTWEKDTWAFIVNLERKEIYLATGEGAYHFQLQGWLDDEEYTDWDAPSDYERDDEVRGRIFENRVHFFEHVDDPETIAREVYKARNKPYTEPYNPAPSFDEYYGDDEYFGKKASEDEWWLEEEEVEGEDIGPPVTIIETEVQRDGHSDYPEDFPFLVTKENVVYLGGLGSHHFDIQMWMEAHEISHLGASYARWRNYQKAVTWYDNPRPPERKQAITDEVNRFIRAKLGIVEDQQNYWFVAPTAVRDAIKEYGRSLGAHLFVNEDEVEQAQDDQTLAGIPSDIWLVKGPVAVQDNANDPGTYLSIEPIRPEQLVFAGQSTMGVTGAVSNITYIKIDDEPGSSSFGYPFLFDRQNDHVYLGLGAAVYHTDIIDNLPEDIADEAYDDYMDPMEYSDEPPRFIAARIRLDPFGGIPDFEWYGRNAIPDQVRAEQIVKGEIREKKLASATIHEIELEDDHGGGYPFAYDANSDTLYIGTGEGFHTSLIYHMEDYGWEEDFLMDLYHEEEGTVQVGFGRVDVDGAYLFNLEGPQESRATQLATQWFEAREEKEAEELFGKEARDVSALLYDDLYRHFKDLIPWSRSIDWTDIENSWQYYAKTAVEQMAIIKFVSVPTRLLIGEDTFHYHLLEEQYRTNQYPRNTQAIGRGMVRDEELTQIIFDFVASEDGKRHALRQIGEWAEQQGYTIAPEVREYTSAEKLTGWKFVYHPDYGLYYLPCPISNNAWGWGQDPDWITHSNVMELAEEEHDEVDLYSWEERSKWVMGVAGEGRLEYYKPKEISIKEVPEMVVALRNAGLIDDNTTLEPGMRDLWNRMGATA